MENIIEFLRICGRLKKILRTGWVNNKVKDPESIASHMYRMAIISMVVDDKDLDKNK
jgi:putative hydrolase of HD superfamily